MLGGAGSIDPSQPGHPGEYFMFIICIIAGFLACTCIVGYNGQLGVR